jgi:glycosyltransferase involved in cell wall biosynthesis
VAALPADSRVLIVSDAWQPQVNGVVRTLATLVRELAALGIVAEVIGPDRFRTLPCPTYPDIRLSVLPRRKLSRLMTEFRPDALHIATEGPLGLAARKLARSRGWTFTTAFHTRFPEYLRARVRVPTRLSYAWLRRFHAAGRGLMVATESLRQELAGRGFRDLRAWSRGVDLSQFRPEPREAWEGMARPVFLYVGRVAVEKNIAAFLDLALPGSKVVVGEGPQLAALKGGYPSVHFAGIRHGEALSAAYAGADVMVFPSLTDTFGLVILESLACGTPVAAYPVTGPKDVLAAGGSAVGAVADDLRQAALDAWAKGDRAACRRYAETFSWRACAERFVTNLVPIRQGLSVEINAAAAAE